MRKVFSQNILKSVAGLTSFLLIGQILTMAVIPVGAVTATCPASIYPLPSQGPNNPSDVLQVDSSESQDWDNHWDHHDDHWDYHIDYVKSSDDKWARVSLDDNEISNSLKVTNFGFSVPTGATISGIVVDIERSVNKDTTDTCNQGNPHPYYSPVQDAEVKIINASGNVVGANRATVTNYTKTDVYESHGGQTDLWGLTLTPGNINDSDFGVNIKVKKNGNNCGDIETKIDHVKITVYYGHPPVVSGVTASVDENASVSVTLLATDAGEAPAFSIVSEPTNGILSEITGNQVTYTPNQYFNGADSFTFVANDGIECSGIATANITVNPVNSPPIINSLTITPSDPKTNDMLTANVSASDVDPEDILSYAYQWKKNGSDIGMGGGLNFDLSIPDNGDKNDVISIVVTANDGKGGTDVKDATVTILNTAPVASLGNASGDEHNPITGSFNVTDADANDTFSYEIVTQPFHGIVELIAGQLSNYRYSPTGHFFGPDSFVFKANDGVSDSNPASITVTVNPVNDAPVASDTSASVAEDASVTFPLPASDPKEDALTFSIVSGPVNGTAIVSGDQATYAPSSQYNGADSFTFKANDGFLDSNIATATIAVSPVNYSPIATDQQVSVNEDESVSITLSASDPDQDPLTYAIVNGPSHGVLDLISGQQFTYAPELNFNGNDSFTFKANDGIADSNTATVTININPVNDPPVLAPIEGLTIEELESITFNAVATDPESDIETLTFSLINAPAGAVITSDGNFSWTPTEEQGPGEYAFSVQVSDGSLTDSEDITIKVNEVNVAPVAADGSETTVKGTPKVVTLIATDSDIPINTLTYSIVSGPTNGTLSEITNNQVTYTPKAKFRGADSFTFKVNDGTLDSNVATIAITVNNLIPGNQAPVLDPIGNKTVNKGAVLTFTVSAIDLDDDALTFSASNLPAGASFDPVTGVFSWLPAEAGVNTVKFIVSDGNLTAEEIITITVNQTQTVVTYGGGGGGYTPITPTTDNGIVSPTFDRGGVTSIIAPDGAKITLTIPSGTVLTGATFTIAPVSPENLQQGDFTNKKLIMVGGYVYSITASDSGGAITTFSNPLTITFTYSDSQISGLDENSLKMYFWDTAKSEWVAADTQINKDTNELTVSVNHLTVFSMTGTALSQQPVVEIQPTTPIILQEIVQPIPPVVSVETEIQPNASEEGEVNSIPEVVANLETNPAANTGNLYEATKNSTLLGSLAAFGGRIVDSNIIRYLVVLLGLALVFFLGREAYARIKKGKRLQK